MKLQALRFTLILLSNLTLSTLTTVSVAQTQDYSRVNLPDGAIVRLGKGGVSYEDRGIAFSPDGSRLAVATSMGVWLYDTETFDELALLTGHKEEVTAVAFSPDGTKLASVSGFHLPGILKLWDVETGQNIATFQVESGSVDSVAFSPDGTKLAWADRLWDVETRQQLDTLHDNRLFDVAFSPDGKILAGTDISVVDRTRTGVVKFYDVETGRLINTLTATQRTKWDESSKRVSSIAFSPDGRLLASGSADDGTIKLWDIETGQNTAIFTAKPEDGSSMLCVVFSPDGTKLAVGSAEGIKLLEVSTGQHIYTRQHIDLGELESSAHIFSVAFSLNGRKLASASWDGVKLWDAETGQNLTTLRGHTRVVDSVAFSPDGLTLASNSADGAQVWEVDTGRHITTLAGSPNFVTSIAYSPDGTKLATGSANARNAEHTIKLWDVETRQNLTTLQGHTDLVTTVAYSRDGTLLWDVGTGQFLAILTDGTDSPGFAVAFSPDGTKLASGSWDFTVKLWNVSTRKHIATFPGHIGWVSSVAFSPDSTKLASGSSDGTVLLWDVPKSIKLYPSKQHSDR